MDWIKNLTLKKKSSILYTTQTAIWIKQIQRTKYIAMLHFLLLGAEISLVTPTVAFYLEELNAPNLPVFNGMVFGAYCLAGIVFALILSRVVDTTLRFRIVMIFINVIAIWGNAFYIIGYSPYMVILARFLAGVAEAIFPVVYGELARCYAAQDFPRHAAHLMTAYCFGISVSPGLNMVPKEAVLDLGFVTIRYTNAPGAILFCLYVIQLIIVSVALPNLSLNKQRNKLDAKYLKHLEYEKLDDFENNTQDEDENLLTDYPESRTISDERIVVSKSTWWKVLLDMLKRREILILLYGQVVWAYSLFNGIVLLPLTAIRYLKFNHQQVSIFYVATGAMFGFVLYFSSSLIAKYGPVMTSIGAFLLNFTGSLFLYLTVLSERVSISIRAVFFVVFGLSYFLAWFSNTIALKSTLSMHVPMEDQSFCQGVFTMAEQVTSFLASITSGFAFSIIELYCVWSIALNLVAIFVFVIYYQNLKDPGESLQREK